MLVSVLGIRRRAQVRLFCELAMRSPKGSQQKLEGSPDHERESRRSGCLHSSSFVPHPPLPFVFSGMLHSQSVTQISSCATDGFPESQNVRKQGDGGRGMQEWARRLMGRLLQAIPFQKLKILIGRLRPIDGEERGGGYSWYARSVWTVDCSLYVRVQMFLFWARRLVGIRRYTWHTALP